MFKGHEKQKDNVRSISFADIKHINEVIINEENNDNYWKSMINMNKSLHHHEVNNPSITSKGKFISQECKRRLLKIKSIFREKNRKKAIYRKS